MNVLGQQVLDSAECASAGDIYAKMLGWQRILEDLRQTDKALQAEYEKIDAKIKNECDKIGKDIAIYLDVSGSRYIASELGAALQKEGCGCSIAESVGKASYVITVKAKLNLCKKADFGEVYCYTSANVSVKNAKTNKNFPVQVPEAMGAWIQGDTKKATEESFMELTENIAKELLKEIKK